MSKHKKDQLKTQFCCTRAKKCKCGNEYRTCCDPGWTGTSGSIHFEAHHILCVASVKGTLFKKRTSIYPTVKNTKWCVNNKGNMIALPLWGDTVRWYHAPVRRLKKSPDAPPFKNLPQHDWDHNGSGSYRTEVEKALMEIAEEIDDAVQNHEVKSVNIAAKLRGKSTQFRNLLKSRGAGTHRNGWMAGKNGSATWYKPFSMAAIASEKGYPAQNFMELVSEKLKALGIRV